VETPQKRFSRFYVNLHRCGKFSFKRTLKEKKAYICKNIKLDMVKFRRKPENPLGRGYLRFTGCRRRVVVN
jgi:hypothetical protein